MFGNVLINMIAYHTIIYAILNVFILQLVSYQLNNMVRVNNVLFFCPWGGETRETRIITFLLHMYANEMRYLYSRQGHILHIMFMKSFRTCSTVLPPHCATNACRMLKLLRLINSYATADRACLWLPGLSFPYQLFLLWLDEMKNKLLCLT